ncbi:CGNR zinc finger domain-containing protein [Paenibacillus sp. 1P07SE]|uniref:CGNR zinc finger domain-containing protein n=1 Tax=Paenibacillus sp. 1P07SE TaxID=3132209 RepID=UPI0039A4FFB6
MSSREKFPLVSGHVALDLINTEVVKRGIRHDLLAGESDLAEWMDLMKESEDSFSAFSVKSIDLGSVLPALKELRALLRTGFEAFAAGMQAEASWIHRIEELNKRAPLSFQLSGGSLVPVPIGASEDAILSLIAFDTLRLVANGELQTLRRCANTDCVLLFIDTSGRRKWCSMNTCGNRSKVARHQSRQKER